MKKRPQRPELARIDDNIRHVIVLMMENRSFDHILGAMPGVDGVNTMPPFTNREPKSQAVFAQESNAVRKLKPDPAHEFKNVMRQIDPGTPPGPMGGFVYDFAQEYPKAQGAHGQVMAYFPDGLLPATHQLAKSFCVGDRWFSSVPGPTWTNRFFMHSGTSQGWVNMPTLPFHWNLHKYDQTTIYDRLHEAGVRWAIYAGDIPQSLLLANQRKVHNAVNYHRMSTFYSDLRAAATDDSSFPSYVFIEPSYLPGGQNDQHPPHDILKGDDLIGSVYNAVRATPAVWDSTLLIVIYDEHGGFADHVSPPAAVPPDDKHQEGCEFNRYGVRVPAILISKWVRPGSVFRPQAGTLDHTSVLRYLSDKFNLGSLLARTASAATISDALVAPPTDGPERVGVTDRPLEMTAALPEMDPSPEELNVNQAALIDFTRQLELESGALPADAGIRAMRATESVQGEVEVAKERVWMFIDRKKAEVRP